MLTRVVTAAAVALGVVCPAHADMSSDRALGARVERTVGSEVDGPHGHAADELARAREVTSLVIGVPSTSANLERVTLALRSDPHGPNATLTLVLTTRARVARDVITSIEVPSGTRATGLALAMGDERSIGTPLSPTTADDRYRAVMQGGRDPALLALRGWTQTHDRLGLHVFPLVRGTPATVTIDMYLPEAATLEISAPARAHHEVTIDGRAYSSGRLARARPISPEPVVIELPLGFGRRATELATRDSAIGPIELTLRDPSGDRLQVRDLQERHVSGGTSLFADAPPVPVVVPGVVIGCGFGHATDGFTVDKKTIRKVVRAAMPRLRHCYLREAQRTPSLEGSADLHFTIDRDGRISDLSIDGTLASEAARACMADEVQSWTFPASSGATAVNYPLTYQLNR